MKKRQKVTTPDYSRVMEHLEKRAEANAVLMSREQECFKNGHPGYADRRCSYCYAPEGGYRAPQMDAILAEREKLPSMMRPCDAPVTMEKMERERSAQRMDDLGARMALLEKEQNAR